MGMPVGGANDDGQMTLMRAQGETDRQSSSSTMMRDMMEAFSPEKVLGSLMEVFKALASISG